MAAPKRSGWGSFLSQAVAGVEARLDNILAEGETGDSAQQKESKPASASAPALASPVKQSPAPSRTASTARPNDRLQERLARAMAAKAGQKADVASSRTSLSNHGSPRQSIDAPSRPSTESLDRPSSAAKDPTKDASSPRASQDVTRGSDSAEQPDKAKELPNGEKGADVEAEVNGTEEPTNAPQPEKPIAESEQEKPDVDGQPKPEPQPSVDVASDSQPAETEKPQERATLEHQEEIHYYVERIDALESKLQYLARETSEAARKAAVAAPAGSAEKKLAEKDQQIAQLMEEGKNLASTEQKHRAILKRLRTKMTEDERELTSIKAAKEKSDKELESLRLRAKRADELERAQGDLQKRLDQAQRELNAIRPELRAKDNIISELKSQLQKASEQADAMAAKVNDQAREQDKKRISELEESVAALQVEKNLVGDRAKIQANELKEKAERASERARALELELKAEVQTMESKLEAMRIRAEEASSGAIGDSQAKLLRQVETLQTQYSIASENWQGIEATLLARIANMEKERDEALQRESDMRKKAREAAVRAKRHEEELEETKTRLPNMQQDVKSYEAQLDSLRKRAEEAESALEKSRADFEKQKQAWEAEKEETKQQRHQAIDRPRSWLEDLPGASYIKSESRPDSPQLSSPQRTFSTDFLGIQSLTSKARKVSAPSSNGEAGDKGGFVRRASGQPPIRPSIHSTVSSLFSPSAPLFSPSIEALPTPLSATHPLDREDAFEGVETGSSPQQVMQDMVSVSTVGAGPSVQLVERMSAAIRRLESEKVAAKEELARISKQRDEARAEILALMKEVEGGKAAGNKATELEKEVEEVKQRYETTLELLGEKSEEVEELRADVEDVKAMYRDLVERTIK
ncbi:hypothetical protein OQA88_6812 [Cercophora sp. LCS_1]